jgi:hypothetical protein
MSNSGAYLKNSMRTIFLIGLMLLLPAGMRGATKPYGQWSHWLRIKDPGYELYYRVLAYQTTKTDSWHHQLELENRGTIILKVELVDRAGNLLARRILPSRTRAIEHWATLSKRTEFYLRVAPGAGAMTPGPVSSVERGSSR